MWGKFLNTNLTLFEFQNARCSVIIALLTMDADGEIICISEKNCGKQKIM